MDSLENLVISFIDVEANKGLFRKELAGILNVSPNLIGEPFFEYHTINGVLKQFIFVDINMDLSKEDLLKIPFTYFDGDGYLVFDAGDVIL